MARSSATGTLEGASSSLDGFIVLSDFSCNEKKGEVVAFSTSCGSEKGPERAPFHWIGAGVELVDRASTTSASASASSGGG